VLEDLISFSDLLFGADSPRSAPGMLPPGSGLSKNGVISYHPVDDGPQPGSSRTRIQISAPGEDIPLGLTEDTENGASNTLVNPESITRPALLQRTSSESSRWQSWTPDDELTLLFPSSLIPDTIREAVGEDIHVNDTVIADIRSAR
jgi:hypothetical protein